MSSSSESKQAYQAKVKAQLDKLNAQIDELKAKAAQAKADASIEYNSQMEQLYARRDAAQSKLEKIQQAGADAVLIGESLVKQEDLEGAVNRLFT